MAPVALRRPGTSEPTEFEPLDRARVSAVVLETPQTIYSDLRLGVCSAQVSAEKIQGNHTDRVDPAAASPKQHHWGPFR